jgi:hypothetical protein
MQIFIWHIVPIKWLIFSCENANFYLAHSADKMADFLLRKCKNFYLAHSADKMADFLLRKCMQNL